MWRMVSLVVFLGLGAYFYFGQMNSRNAPGRVEQMKQAQEQAKQLESEINKQKEELNKALEGLNN